mgnify:FL=1
MNCRLMQRIRSLGRKSLRSNHLFSDKWWNPCGVVNRYYTNLAPDDGPIGKPENPGARAGLHENTGVKNVSVEVVWCGNSQYGAGPTVCINPDAKDFGLGFWYEKLLYGGTLVLWALGRQPSDIRMIACLNDAGYHTDGAPVKLRMDVIGNSVKCYRDNELMITETVPDELVGSTIHGLSVDVNAAQPRQPNLPCAVAPYSWRAI